MARFDPRLVALSAILALPFAACGGSSSAGGSSSVSGFQLLQISVSNGIVWKINRPVRFTFSDAVDFATINNNSINIVQASGKPALGTFVRVLGAPNVVEFLPTCPTKDDFSDAGLIPGNVRYDVTVLGEKGGTGLAVTSAAGKVLQQSQTRYFFTPSSLILSEIFQDVDPTQGPVPALELIDLDGNGKPDVAEHLTRLERGGDSSNDLRFTASNVAVDADGDTVLKSVQDLNLYSVQASRVAVVLELNQPVNPAASNIDPSRVRLEFRPDDGSTVWEPLPTRVGLVANCTTTGATLRLEPEGILPQGSKIRVVITSALEDLVGQSSPQDLASDFLFRTRVFDEPDLAQPSDGADELLETFTLSGDAFGSLEDEDAPFAVPHAEWGGGRLRASFAFEGTGGPGGDFDLRVPANTTLPIDTTFAIVNGGPSFTFGKTQTVIAGVLNVRNLRVEAGGVLQATGPNPLIVQATGTVEILGVIDVNGGGASDVATLDTGNQPESGGSGVAGGGAGGGASTVTNNSTPRGSNGEGAFRVPNLGGRGGETAYSNNVNEDQRRPGGGGGGRFAADLPNVTLTASGDPLVGAEAVRARLTSHYLETANPNNLVVSAGWGSQARQGRNGNPNGKGAITNQSPAKGGEAGPGPFFDTSPSNDFWGLQVLTVAGVAAVVQGELKQAQAGAGGGGGGDGTKSNTFPPKNWKPDTDEKGGGGGGGAGQLQILCLRDIVFGAGGRIEARGGRGGSGENTIGLDHIGGGGGGGSGGHVILQTPGKIDFRACTTQDVTVGKSPFLTPFTVKTVTTRAISAHGGRGAMSGATAKDSTGSWQGQGAGGDGGPGLIQLHVLAAENLLLPAGVELRHVTEPTPYVLVPTFGGVSKARSRWVALGGASFDPTDPASPDAVHFRFAGTRVVAPVSIPASGVDPATDTFTSPGQPFANGDLVRVSTGGTLPGGLTAGTDYYVVGATADTFELATTKGGFALNVTSAGTGTHVFTDPTAGFVLSTGEVVDELAPVLTGTLAPGSVSGTQVRIDAAAWLGTPDDVYLRNPSLLRNFLVRFGAQELAVVAASSAKAKGGLLTDLSLVLDGAPAPGASSFELVPLYFRVVTSEVEDRLPSGAHVKLEFQGTSADAAGNPSIPPAGTEFLVPWTSDVEAFEATVPGDLAFFRFRVEFELGGQLSSSTPRPELQFVRLPFVF